MEEDDKKFMEAVGERDLDLELSESEIRALQSAMRKFASSARLANSIAERPDQTELYGPLANELAALSESQALEVFEKTGLANVLDEHGHIVFSELKQGDIPKEDLDFLRQCGMLHPEHEITISLTRLKYGYWLSSENKRRATTAEVMQMTRHTMRRSSKELRVIADERAQQQSLPASVQAQPIENKKPKKYFNGIGKILSGVVAGTGNVLIGTGAIPATGGAAAAGVIASAAVSVGIIMQGIGDLRGE